MSYNQTMTMRYSTTHLRYKWSLTHCTFRNIFFIFWLPLFCAILWYRQAAIFRWWKYTRFRQTYELSAFAKLQSVILNRMLFVGLCVFKHDSHKRIFVGRFTWKTYALHTDDIAVSKYSSTNKCVKYGVGVLVTKYASLRLNRPKVS